MSKPIIFIKSAIANNNESLGYFADRFYTFFKYIVNNNLVSS